MSEIYFTKGQTVYSIHGDVGTVEFVNERIMRVDWRFGVGQYQPNGCTDYGFQYVNQHPVVIPKNKPIKQETTEQ